MTDTTICKRCSHKHETPVGYCASYAILSEDSQGFVEYGAYDTEEKVMADWKRVQSGEPAWYEEDDE